MKKMRNLNGLTLMCLAMGLVTLGCNETQTAFEAPSENGTTLTASTTESCCANENSEGCAACAHAALAAAKAGDCSDCPACAGSETAQCKCEQGSEVSAKLADNKTPASSCCGKCAQEQNQLATLKTNGCDDCTECTDGDSAKCKCLDDDSSKAKPADAAPPEKK